jgi:hypothetical protein
MKDILKTSSAEEENILGNVALSLQRRKRNSCECSAPVGCYTRPPNSTPSLPFPGMTNTSTLYTIPLVAIVGMRSYKEDIGEIS